MTRLTHRQSFFQQQLEQCKPWLVKMVNGLDGEDFYQEVCVACLDLDQTRIDWSVSQRRRICTVAHFVRRRFLKEKQRQRFLAFSEIGCDAFRLEQTAEHCEAVETQDSIASLRRALMHLQRDHRLATEQHYFHCVPDREIAKQRRVGVETIRRWRARAIRQLRSVLDV